MGEAIKIESGRAGVSETMLAAFHEAMKNVEGTFEVREAVALRLSGELMRRWTADEPGCRLAAARPKARASRSSRNAANAAASDGSNQASHRACRSARCISATVCIPRSCGSPRVAWGAWPPRDGSGGVPDPSRRPQRA